MLNLPKYKTMKSTTAKVNYPATKPIKNHGGSARVNYRSGETGKFSIMRKPFTTLRLS